MLLEPECCLSCEGRADVRPLWLSSARLMVRRRGGRGLLGCLLSPWRRLSLGKFLPLLQCLHRPEEIRLV